jgi:predicted aspartyl protease
MRASRRTILGTLLGAITSSVTTVVAIASGRDRNRCSAKPIGEVTVATLSNAPIVTLFANGHPVVLLLDTGAERTVLTPAVARRIGATAPRIEFEQQIHGIAGSLAGREVELRSFVVGRTSIPWRRVVVAPVSTPHIFSMPLDGLLGADVLSGFDVDLDLTHHRMFLYQKRSCPNGPPWAGSYTAIGTGQSRATHLFFPVQLDGHTIVAVIDSGAQRSFLSGSVARALGVTEALLAQDRMMTTQGVTAQRLSSHLHRFSELRVGTETIRNPEFVVGAATLRDADIVLGVDFLNSRRVWLSYGSLQIYLSGG